MKRLGLLCMLSAMFLRMDAQEKAVSLSGKQIQINWLMTKEGWKINSVVFNRKKIGQASGEYTLLFSETKPPDSPQVVFNTITGKAWPDTSYRYQIKAWQQATSPVALNTAGEASYFFPGEAKRKSNAIVFTNETSRATVIAEWMIDPDFETDVLVKQTMICKRDGYYSLASPSIATVPQHEIAWATVPGYFQGNTVQDNLILSYAYGQGIPAFPVIFRERCSSTFGPIISSKQQFSFSVIPAPGLGRDPWASNKNTHPDWFMATSHRNRRAELTPTMYYPVLGEQGSLHKAGDTIQFSFRYSFTSKDWQQLLTHAANDVYDFNKTLKLRKNTQSLSSRVDEMHEYLVDRKTSLWNIENYKGLTIGGQSYLGGVVGSNKDAQKNSDYGAMWMLANTSNDQFLKDSVLPFALNFKLVQQQTEPGFFRGAAIGQYYLAKRKMFVEEWGEFVEPVSLTYYIMLDIGNILLFEPNNAQLRERLSMGAELLLNWQKADGSWEVAYDRDTHAPLFTDIKDLRPTFYGMMVAYRILKDEKYLAAAKKGADWFITNAVDKGNFIGVCGDARYAPDFATAQSAQALLDLYDLTKESKYQEAAIKTAKMYLTSIYTQPVADTKRKTVSGIERKDWQIAQSGLSFEHGGIIGSANGAGPIMLCSHAGLFVRMFGLTGDSLFIQMARAAAIGRDAFVDSATSVASYYWTAMNRGAGPYPHHAWWQIGWITDYVLAEAQLRSKNKVVFPRGFVTPKVGPHQSYGFASGKIFGEDAKLIMRKNLIRCDNPNIEYITAESADGKKLYVVLLNDIGEKISGQMQFDINAWKRGANSSRLRITDMNQKRSSTVSTKMTLDLESYGWKVYVLE